MDLVDEGWCFVCGPNNPIGLKVDFEVDEPNLKIRGVFTPRREHQGYNGIMHGGLASTLLDEAMVKLLWEVGIPAVSGSLEIKLVKPARVGEPLVVKGWVEAQKGRIYRTGARLEDMSGDIVAEAKATCVRVTFKEDGSVS